MSQYVVLDAETGEAHTWLPWCTEATARLVAKVMSETTGLRLVVATDLGDTYRYLPETA